VNILDIMKIDNEHFPSNVDTIQLFVNYLKLQGKKKNTIRSKIITTKIFLDFIRHRKAETITRIDIEGFVLHLKENGMKPDSQNVNIVNLKLFITFLTINNEKFKKKRKGEDYFQNIKLNKQTRDTSEKEYLTREDISKLLLHCKSQRDRAFLILLWDTGARLGEILNINIGDIKYGKQYTTAILTGKTGTREVVMSASVPDIQLYLNQRKEAQPSDPLFISYNGRLKERSVQNFMKKLVNKSGIQKEGKKTNVHSARHGRMTELANKDIPEMHLRKYAGWFDNSDMPSKYIHVQQKEVDKKILLSDGYTPEEITEEQKPEISTKPIKCACGQLNPFDSPRCSHCTTILNEKLAMETREQEIEAERQKMEALKAEIKDELMASMIAENAKTITELAMLAEKFKGIKEFDEIFTTGKKKDVRDKLPDNLKPEPMFESEALHSAHDKLSQLVREQRRKEIEETRKKKTSEPLDTFADENDLDNEANMVD
jgi:site-specific recombinase XerD